MPATNDNDDLTGTDGPDTLNGLAGNDTLRGGAGDDSLLGGSGDDTILGDEGANTLLGGDGNDVLTELDQTDPNLFDGGAGNDSLWGGEASDTMNGSAGADFINGMGGNDVLDGGEGPDQLNGYDGNDWLSGGDGNDAVSGGNGNDTVSGGLGDDSVYGGDGTDVVIGGDGNDAVYAGGRGEKTLVGGAGNDTLTAGMDSAFLDGGDGADLLSAQQARNTGDNTLLGGAGDDTLYSGSGNDSLSGGDGADVLYATGQTGHPVLDGGAGNDALSGGNSTADLLGGDGDDTLTGSGVGSAYSGGAGNDSLHGEGANSYFDGGEGDDTIWGGQGATIVGGDGNDSISTGTGSHYIEGGAGDDTIDASGGYNTISGGSGWDLIFGSFGDDLYLISSPQTLILDPGGNDSAIVSASFIKLPSQIESVTYVDGAQPLPYWIDAMLPSAATGLAYQELLGPSHTFGFAFPDSAPAYIDFHDSDGYTPFNAAQRTFAREAFHYIESVVDLHFAETGDTEAANVIALANNSQDSAAYALFPSSSFIGSDAFFDKDYAVNLAPTPTNYGGETFVHEIGHTLGLKHPGAYGGSWEGPVLGAGEDSSRWSVMSYTSTGDTSAQYRALDIAALQFLYGPSKVARIGDDSYAVSAGTPNFIWDGGGMDTLDASFVAVPVTLYLEPGWWGYIGAKASSITSAGQVTVNFGSVIENLRGGSGGDYLAGNSVANVIDGGAGSDTLAGGEGSDTLVGGAGLDDADYTKPFANYKLLRTSDAVQVVDTQSGDTDLLSGVERLHFNDISVALDIDGTAGKAYRLYQAAFDRKPDLGGLGYQMHDLDLGYSLAHVAANFIASPEFQSKYGNVDNAQFVSLLYQHVLHRTPQQFEVDFHVNNELLKGYSRADVLTFFSESPENQANVIGDIQYGMIYIG